MEPTKVTIPRSEAIPMLQMGLSAAGAPAASEVHLLSIARTARTIAVSVDGEPVLLVEITG